LIRVTTSLHREGLIPPNTVVFDLDSISANAELIKQRARELGLHVYFMTKQCGRNPLIARAIVDPGTAQTVAVEVDGAYALHRAGVRLGHVGNLVQIPTADIPTILRLRPEVMTVHTVAKAEQVSAAAERLGLMQDILFRVRNTGDVFLTGMEAGINLDDLQAAVRRVSDLPGVRLVGVSTFPAVYYKVEKRAIEPTPNFTSVQRAAEMLRELGVEVRQINTPGNTSYVTLDMFARMGATHVEPGHGFLGTTPLHLTEDLPEVPTYVYLSEVSHTLDGLAYTYGGGHFIDDRQWAPADWQRTALVGDDPHTIFENRVPFIGTGPREAGGVGFLDYHGILETQGQRAAVGDTVILGFRVQTFATRCNTAVIGGLRAGTPTLLGVFDTAGNRVQRYP
jgi:predicted amino acid racemase